MLLQTKIYDESFESKDFQEEPGWSTEHIYSLICTTSIQSRAALVELDLIPAELFCF